jgi:hypothetical protein
MALVAKSRAGCRQGRFPLEKGHAHLAIGLSPCKRMISSIIKTSTTGALTSREV